MSNFKSELKGLSRFQPIPRDLIQDCGLSAQARFVYAYMAAKPEGWEFWQEVMSKEVGMSVATLRKYLYELRDAGWLEIGKQSHIKGFGAVQYILKAVPYADFCVAQKTCDTKIVTHENCVTQNLAHIDNIDIQEKKDISKKTKGKDTPALSFPFSSDKFRETWEALCEEKNWKGKTQKALQLTLNKLGRYDEAFAIELMEKTIENGWKGCVFADTDAKYQEWMSARQLAKDNAVPRTNGGPTQAFNLAKDTSRTGDFYKELQRRKAEEERQMREEIEQYKREHGYTD